VAPWLRVGDGGRVTVIGSDDALVVHADVEWGIDRVESRLPARQAVDGPSAAPPTGTTATAG